MPGDTLISRLPPEIWVYILSFVCTDDGLNGRSLAQVSRTFRDLVDPVKFQSICTSRHEELIAFTRLLSRLPPERRRIQYLCVATPDVIPLVDDVFAGEPCLPHLFDGYPDEELNTPETGDIDDVPEYSGYLGWRSTEEEVELAEKTQVRVLEILLSFCHESLVHLNVHLIIRREWNPVLTLPFPLPNLRELFTNVDVAVPGVEPVQPREYVHTPDTPPLYAFSLPSHTPASDQPPRFPQLRLLGFRVNTFFDLVRQISLFIGHVPALETFQLALRESDISDCGPIIRLLPDTVRQCVFDITWDRRVVYTRLPPDAASPDGGDGISADASTAESTSAPSDPDILLSHAETVPRNVPGWKMSSQTMWLEPDWLNSDSVAEEWLGRVDESHGGFATSKTGHAHWFYTQQVAEP